MESNSVYLIVQILVTAITHISPVNSHGRLMDPPSRNSMWRMGYPNPANFNDNELFCGGIGEMNKNNGKCGVCGDNFALKPPRPHETGGAFGNRIVTRKYITGQKINVSVELTANHMGTFEFRICQLRNSRVEVTQACLDKSPVPFVMEDGRLENSYPVTGKASEIYDLLVQLPKNMPPCRNCVFQWTYTTGNSWGTCPDGSEGIGCGPQETFKNCADISVFDPFEDVRRNNLRSSTIMVPKKNPNLLYYKDYTTIGAPMKPFVLRAQYCVGIGKLKEIPGIDDWCQFNCLRYPPLCPKDTCRCITKCEAVGDFRNVTGSDLYCQDKCNVYPPKNCPKNKCMCT